MKTMYKYVTREVSLDTPMELYSLARWARMVEATYPDGVDEPDLLRVQVNPDGKFDIVDFTTARRNGRLLYHNVPQEDIPTWIVEAVSMLRIADAQSPVQSIGFKVNDKLYYIVDKRGENEKS